MTDVKLNSTFDVPILLITFNRPTLAVRVFERIRQIRPETLYVATDGPRASHPNDVIAIEQCHNIIQQIDWPCEVKTLFGTENIGCKYGPYSAINWFFKHEPYGIILEDDCLPDLTFFNYCRTLLIKYKDNEEIMHIGGSNLFADKTWGKDSYFFTKVTLCWGWASWRRAWAHYDINMSGYPKFEKARQLDDIVVNKLSRSYFRHFFRITYAGQNSAWDYQWVWTIWANNGLAIMPNQNLISNIGFGETATHTFDKNSEFSNLPTRPINYNEMLHPVGIHLNYDATQYGFAHIFQFSPRWSQLKALKKQPFKLVKYVVHRIISLIS